MQNRILHIFLAVMSIASMHIDASALPSDYKATATVDSTTMTMGSKTILKVDFTGPLMQDARIEIDNPDNPELEIQAEAKDGTSSKDIGNGRKQLQRLMTVQIFDSGLYVMPRIYCISGTDTVIPQSPAVKVMPIGLDSVNVITNSDGSIKDLVVHDFSDVAPVNARFWDFLPDVIEMYGWWILLAVIAIAAILYCYFKWFRHGRNPLIPQKKKTPPYELAVRQLAALQEKKLWQRGAEKEYYTQLTDILRTYLYGRFGINAMEMTTKQIMDAIAECEQIVVDNQLVGDVLSEADFVKFAKATPAADVNERVFTHTRQFVESTKPIIVEPEKTDAATSTNNGGQKQNETTQNYQTKESK